MSRIEARRQRRLRRLRASDVVADWYAAWLAAGIHVVTPNKRAASGPLERWRHIGAAAQSSGAHLGYEGTVGIGYNKKMFDEKGWAAPTSWMDFADPKYKGKVVFQSIQSSTFGLHSFLMFNRLVGGTDKNVEPGFQKWGSTVGPNVLEYLSSSAKISEMVQTGETAIFPLTPTAIANLKAKGIPAEFATPKEGAVMLMVGACALKNNSEPELSQKLAEYLLSAGSQAKAVEYANAIPINKNVKIPESVQAKIGNVDKLMKNINTVDWDVINKDRAAWNDRWSRMIER